MFPPAVWAHVVSLVSDGELRRVADADYGRRAEEHYQALLALRSGPVEAVRCDGWCPGEVILLTLCADEPAAVKADWPGYLFCIAVSLILCEQPGRGAFHAPADRQILARHLAGLDDPGLLDAYVAWRIGRPA